MFTNQCLVTCIILHDFVVNYEDGGRTSQKIPPHEQVLEEGAIVFLILHPIKVERATCIKGLFWPPL